MSVKSNKAGSSLATAKDIITAFRTQSVKVRRMVIQEILEDEKLREDVGAALLWEERKDEPSRPLREYLAEHEAD